MIYELALVANSQVGDEGVAELTSIVKNALSEFQGEVLLEDNWGSLMFAQPTSSGTKNGHYLYFIYKAETNANNELERLFKINENVLKSLIIKVGATAEEGATFIKAYKCPYSKIKPGSVTDDLEEADGGDMGKDRRRFSKRKNCWFAATKIRVDWKDPKTFGWLINEFGKISPARVSGISRKHQRFAETAIKRARQIGVASYLTNRFAD